MLSFLRRSDSFRGITSPWRAILGWAKATFFFPHGYRKVTAFLRASKKVRKTETDRPNLHNTKSAVAHYLYLLTIVICLNKFCCIRNGMHLIASCVLRLRWNTHTQDNANFDSPLSRAGLGRLAEGYILCLNGLTGSSTPAGTGCTDFQHAGSSVADCQALT